MMEKYNRYHSGKRKRFKVWKIKDYHINWSRPSIINENVPRCNKIRINRNNNRFSTANYRSRNNYSIKIVILEKRLILDHSVLERK